MPEPPARITTKMASTPNNHLHNHHHHHHNHQPHHHHPSLSSSASNMATTASTSSLLGSSSSKIVIEENGSHSDLLLLPANKPPVNIISVCTGTATGTTNTPNTAWSCDKPEKGEKFVIPDDVRKVGYMRKWKTNKRKYFVLRLNNNLDLSHATLSYYDSEKKFRANMENTSQVPRRTTLLRQCLAIHRKYDSKHKNVMAVYTKEDMLAAICEEEATLNEWLEAIRTILMLSANIDFAFKSVRDFFSRCEHIWQIQLSRVGLGLSRGILGTHRMCLTGKAILYMVRVDPTLDGPDIHEFPLNSIRRCGHTNSTFFLELGRSSMIGPGELWIQTEDSLMAQHMHECILAAMSSGHHTTHHHTTHHHQSGTSTVVVPREVIFDQTPLPTSSSSTSSGHKRSSSGHRPRSSSASNETAKASGQQVVAHIGSNSSISRSNSTRGAKSQCQSMSPTTSTASKDANGNTEPVHGHFVHFSPGPPHYFGHTTVVHCNRNGVIQQSSTSSSQSPSTSRERLCSGSWSRTTSECSNDDGSSSGGCGACSASSSAANTPLGPPGTTTSVFCDCMSASSHQIWSTVAIPCSCYAGAISNFHMDCHSSTNNSTSSSMDCIDSMFVPDHDSFAVAGPSSGMLSLEPAISEEVDGCNSDEYYAMVAQTNTTTTMSTNGKSSSNNSISSMISSKSLTTPCSATVHQLHYVPHHLFCVHMPHLRPTRSNSMSASDRVGGHTGSSTINSPKCHCSGCQNHYNNGGHFTLPTVPAGTDADYLPMSPLGGSSDAIQENESTTASTEQVNATTTSTTPTPKDHHHRESTSSSASSHRGHHHHRGRKEEEEEEGYLEMAPLSPTPKASTSSSSMSTASTAPHTTSSEFHLEKVKSYFNADQKTIARHSHHRHHHRQHEDHNHNQAAVMCSNQSSLDDSIFNGLTRAYSTGSKPQPLAPSIAAQCTVAPKSTLIATVNPNHQPTTSSAAQSSNNSSAAAVTANNLRIRAFSTGSHGINLNALRLNSRRLKKQAQHAQAACATSSTSFDAADCQIVSSSSSSSLAEIEAASCAGLVGQMKNNKASSAPILSPLIQQRTRSATLGARPSSFAYPGQQQQHHHLHHFKLSHPHLVGAHHHGHHHPALVGICCGMPGAAVGGAGGDQMVITNVGEGDLMEIDYSNNKSRSRSNMFSSGKSEHILSSFEEEMIREAKLRNHPRHRKNSISGVSATSETTFASLKSGGSTSLDGSTAVHHSSSSASVQPPGRKRSDSTSAISNFFGPSRPSGQGGHHSGHHQHHSSSFRSGSTFDHLVASFRHSLNLQPSSPSSSQSSTSQPNQTSVTNSFENKMNNNANQIETEENYFMTGPTNVFTNTSKSQEHIVSNKSRSTELAPSSSSSSTAVKSEQQPVKQSFAASLSSKIRSKSTKVSSNEKLKSVQPVEPTPEPSNEYYTMMGPNSHTAPPPPTVHHISAPKPPEELNLETSEFDQMDLETLSKKLEDRAKQHEANHYRNDSDEEASPYVMMTPLEATNTSGRKSAPSSSSHVQKKQKTSTMRSLISSLGSKSSSSHSADANQASADAPRKKSSTFSGRLRLSRNNSHSANNNNNNSDAAKRKKNSKSESSGSLVSGNCATDHVTGPTAPTISATPLAS